MYSKMDSSINKYNLLHLINASVKNNLLAIAYNTQYITLPSIINSYHIRFYTPNAIQAMWIPYHKYYYNVGKYKKFRIKSTVHLKSSKNNLLDL